VCATANQGGGGGRAGTGAGADGVVYLRFPTSCKPVLLSSNTQDFT
jgi:hypothetical protein